MTLQMKANGATHPNGVEVLSCDRTLSGSSMVRLKRRVNQLLKRNHKKLVLDLGRTDHVDLAGLGILIERLKMIRSLNGDIRLCNVPETVSEMFRLIGIGNLMEVYGSREEAYRSYYGCTS